jgi:hypothetical protein
LGSPAVKKLERLMAMGSSGETSLGSSHDTGDDEGSEENIQ